MISTLTAPTRRRPVLFSKAQLIRTWGQNAADPLRVTIDGCVRLSLQGRRASERTVIERRKRGVPERPRGRAAGARRRRSPRAPGTRPPSRPCSASRDTHASLNVSNLSDVDAPPANNAPTQPVRRWCTCARSNKLNPSQRRRHCSRHSISAFAARRPRKDKREEIFCKSFFERPGARRAARPSARNDWLSPSRGAPTPRPRASSLLLLSLVSLSPPRPPGSST